MIRKWIFLVCGCVLVGACRSNPKVVNSEPTSPILPMLPMGSAQVAQDSIGRAPTVALEGKVVSDGEIPAPLSNVQLGLYRQEKERWKEITRLSSSPDGRFRITQKLISGSYEIRVTDPRYQGSLPVYLESKPITDLIVPAHRK